MNEQPMEMPPPLPAHASMDASEVSAPPRVAPPTVAGKLRAPDRPASWPTAVGIIMIVLATGSIATAIWKVLSVVIWMPQEVGSVYWHSNAWLLGSLEVLGGVLAILLLVCAIFLLMRRAWTLVALLVWASAKILVGGGLVVLEQGQGLVSVSDWWAWTFGLISLIWACALPVFTLIWFTRRGVRSTVASWKSPAGRLVL